MPRGDARTDEGARCLDEAMEDLALSIFPARRDSLAHATRVLRRLATIAISGRDDGR
jgi:hypothetical protein